MPGALKISMLIVPDVGTLVLAGCDHDQEGDDRVSDFASPLVKLLSSPHGEDVRSTVRPVLFVKLTVWALTDPVPTLLILLVQAVY